MRRRICTLIMLSLPFGAAAQDAPTSPPVAAAAPASLTVRIGAQPSARWAGYYAALDQGFFGREGLAVTLDPGHDHMSASETMATGRADLLVTSLPAALIARAHGLSLINIAQPFARSPRVLTCLTAAGIDTPDAANLIGQTIATPMEGEEFSLIAWLGQMGLQTDTPQRGPALVPLDAARDLLAQKEVACISRLQFDPAPRPPKTQSEMIDLPLADLGGDLAEDGIYALRPALNDPARAAQMAGFLRALRDGWAWAGENPGAAADILARGAGAEMPDPALADQVRQAAGMAFAQGIAPLGDADLARVTQAMALVRPRPLLAAPDTDGVFTGDIAQAANAAPLPPETAPVSPAPQ